jgi:hypothetical protein
MFLLGQNKRHYAPPVYTTDSPGKSSPCFGWGPKVIFEKVRYLVVECSVHWCFRIGRSLSWEGVEFLFLEGIASLQALDKVRPFFRCGVCVKDAEISRSQLVQNIDEVVEYVMVERRGKSLFGNRNAL